MNSILVFFLMVGATLGYCKLSADLDTICTHSGCDIEGDLQDDGLNLLQRGSVLKSKQHLKHIANAAIASGHKYDPENEVYNDVDVNQAAGAGSDSGSGSSSSPSSSPSSPTPAPPPPPSPTPTPPPPSPSPTPSTAAPSPTTAAPTATQTTTTTTSYSNQTGVAGARDRSHSQGPGTMTMALIGLIIFVGSFCVNWRTEKAATMMETLYERADAACKTVDADKADPANRNSLVLVSGKLTSTALVEDRKFNVTIKPTESAGIRSTVSIYAKVNDGDGKGKGKGKGKGEEHEPKYKWTTMPLLSEPSKSEVTPGIYTNFSSSADLGRGFSVNLNEFYAGFNMNMNESWKDCSFGPEVSMKAKPSIKFKKANDNKYYSGDKEHPKENDIMVEFAQMENGSACTVMALQVASKTNPDKDTFLPYVLIPHACPCYDADSEQEKEALLEGGRAALDADLGLENDDQRAEVKVDCWSLMSCAPCFGVMFKPEIRFIDPTKTCSKEKVLEQMRNTTSTMKLICRIVGYLMLFFGIKWMFDPISAVLHLIPLIGGLLSGLAGFVIWVFALVTSIVIYLLIKIVAAAFFHPARALLYTGVLAIIIIAIVLLSGSSHHHGKHHKAMF